MEDVHDKLKLIYRNEIKVLKFYPNNFDQLRDCFLTLFNEKSFKNYKFKSYLKNQLNKNSTITFLAGGKFSENFEKIKILKNPAVFIFVYDEEDEKEIDKKNLEFIGKKENELGFEINKENKENYLKHIKEQLDEKLKNLDMLKERVDNLNSAIVKIKTIESKDLTHSKIKIEQEDLNNIFRKLSGEPN